MIADDTETGATGTNNIDAAAADWVARSDRATLTADEDVRLNDWLAADPRHLGAFARAQAAFTYLDRARALGTQFDAEVASEPQAEVAVRPLSRRRAFVVGGSLAAAAVVAGLFAVPRFLAEVPPQLYTSKKGEIKLVSLADESVLTLNTQSLVSVDYSRDRRGVELLEGEAMFSVAEDQARPFSVLAGDLEVRAVGTSFMVRNITGRAPEVLVRDGIVDVAYRTTPDSLVRAAANTRVTAESNANGARLVKASVKPDEVERETAWRQGMIAFEGVSLRTAAQEFSRYSDMRIVIDDTDIAHTTITGLFAATNPLGFCAAVATSLGLKVEVGPDHVRLYNSTRS